MAVDAALNLFRRKAPEKQGLLFLQIFPQVWHTFCLMVYLSRTRNLILISRSYCLLLSFGSFFTYPTWAKLLPTKAETPASLFFAPSLAGFGFFLFKCGNQHSGFICTVQLPCCIGPQLRMLLRPGRPCYYLMLFCLPDNSGIERVARDPLPSRGG